MKSFGLLLTMLILSVTLNAQTAEDSVKATINKLFTGMKSADAGMIRSAFADSAILQTITRNKEGATVIRNEAVDGFAKAVSGMPKKCR